MRTDGIDGKGSPEVKRELSGAPPLSFEIGFVLGCLVAGVVLYDSRIGIVTWLLQP